MKTISSEQFKKQYGDETLSQFGVPTKKPGYFQRVSQGLKETFTGLKSDLETQAETIAKEGLETDPSRIKQATALGRGALRTVGVAAKTAFMPLMEAPGIKQGTEFIGEKLTETTPIQKFNEWAGRHPEAAKDIMDILDVASLFGGGKVAETGVSAGVKTAKTTIPKIETGVKTGIQTGKDLISKGKKVLEPPTPTAKEAMGQVLQGKPRDIVSGVKAFKSLDTTGVKTYSELGGKVNESIVNLSKKIDETLDNTKQIGLKELELTGKTEAGKTISADYVSRALKNLKEMYESVGDDVAVQNVNDFLNKAQTVGLTRLEVNNLARKYGIEFGEKAFSKTGEALTSVNAKMFENTRKGLKIIARKGLKGKVAQEIDESITSLYRVKDLVRKNVEAVNKLNQKIQERGLLEKIGYNVVKTTDILTGGSLRGVMAGLLPRSVGYKVMNALDLEQILQRNLDIIQKAIKSGDETLIKLLKKTNPNQ